MSKSVETDRTTYTGVPPKVVTPQHLINNFWVSGAPNGGGDGIEYRSVGVLSELPLIDVPESPRPKTFVSLDLELSGTDKYKHGIVQIGAVAYGATIRHFKSFFYSNCDPGDTTTYDPKAMSVHGIPISTVRESPSIYEVVKDLNEWLRRYRRDTDVIFVGCGIESDLDWLRTIYRELAFNDDGLRSSIEISSLAYPEFEELMGLGKLGARLGIKNGQPHNALADALHAAQIFFKLLRPEFD